MLQLPLNSSRSIPAVGLGFWKIDNALAADVTVQAARLGYRHFDCASDYGNEVEVGQGLRQIVKQGVCSRDDLFVTSKLWNTYHRPEHVVTAVKKSLADLQLDELNLYLIHFPISLAYVPITERYPAGWFHNPQSPNPRMKVDPVPIRETWQAMEELVTAGLVCDIGVCNFGVSVLRDLLSYARRRPAVLQIESHPYLVQQKLVRFCQVEQIAVTAFSPLGAQSYFSLKMANADESVLNDDTVRQIAQRHARTAAQVVLRWGVQRGTAVVPKSVHPERLRENLSIFGFELTDSEMQSISKLDRHRRFNDPGDFCESAFNTFFPIYE